MTQAHTTVLRKEAVAQLQVKPKSWYLDATFGRGGHTAEILKQGGKVVAFDVDQEAIQFGQTEFAGQLKAQQLKLVHANFEKAETEIEKLGLTGQIAGVLADFGLSSPQIEDPSRGFSFQHHAELDMRMDQRLGVQAKDLLALLQEGQLADLFAENGEESSRGVARAIVKQRLVQPITTTTELVALIKRVKPFVGGHLHPATKVFQALRVAVNTELNSIQDFLPQALSVLENTGRIVTISFHEGEDRLVKTAFRTWEQQAKGEHLTHSVIIPSEHEIDQNPRARSAKLRVFQKEV